MHDGAPARLVQTHMLLPGAVARKPSRAPRPGASTARCPSPNRARASNVRFFQRVAWYLADSQIWPLRKSRSSSGGRRRDISMCHRLAWRLPAFRHTSSRPSREILPVQTQDMSAMTASAATTRVADLGARRTNAVRGAGRRVVASASRRVASVTSAEYKARPGRRRAISRFPRVL